MTRSANEVYRAVLSELLALFDLATESKSDDVAAFAMIVLDRIRQIHRRLAPIHSYSDGELEDVVKMLEAHSDVGSDPKLNPGLSARPS